MKRIIIIGSLTATALFAPTGGVQAQSSIEQVLKNIETNNKELQANAQLITSQNWSHERTITCPTPHFLTRIFGVRKIRVKRLVSWLFHKVSISPVCMQRAIS